MRRLLEAQADANAADASGLVPLHFAAQNGHADVVRALGAWRAALDAVDAARGESPLHLAAGYATLANGGLKVTPTLLHGATAAGGAARSDARGAARCGKLVYLQRWNVLTKEVLVTGRVVGAQMPETEPEAGRRRSPSLE